MSTPEYHNRELTVDHFISEPAIATAIEVEGLAGLHTAEIAHNAELTRDLVISLSNALAFAEDLKKMSQIEEGLSRIFRDHLWRTADSLQTQIEAAMVRISPSEMEAWLDVRN